MGATEEKGRGEREGWKEVVAEWAEWQTGLTKFFGGEATCTLEKNKRDFFPFLSAVTFGNFIWLLLLLLHYFIAIKTYVYFRLSYYIIFTKITNC